jgi:UDP-N-acetyl-D-glucosamine dehydrogenase
VMKLLHEKGADVEYSDPYVPFVTADTRHGPRALRAVTLDRDAIKRFDCVVITTDHSGFDYAMVVEHSRSVVDTRNAIGRALHRSQPSVVRLGASGTLPPTAVAA